MQPIKNHWSSYQIAQCKEKLGQAMLYDEHLLAPFREDFGKLLHSSPAAVCEPSTKDELQILIQYANSQQLPITLRGHGLSQSGQSLALPGGLILSMHHFNQVAAPVTQSIWVEANASWASLLESTLPHALVPYVVPHNCHLSIGGVLSTGGVGASSFHYGSATSHVESLEVLQANGQLHQLNTDNELAQACLGGQGYFGLITKACIALRPCKESVRTFFLLYLDKETWLHDLAQCKKNADYIESFCTSAIQGAKLSEKGRLPFAQWFYAIHVAYEYERQAPNFADLALKPWKLLHTQDEAIHSYLHRHDSRFTAMKITGQWNLQHPWYECFITASQLNQLEEILAQLPIYYAPVVHIASVTNRTPSGFFMLPDAEEVFALMILNPGLPQTLIPSCLETIKYLDSSFLAQGGKRYLSGFLGESLTKDYWQQHFGPRYEEWIRLKEVYDPKGIFCSVLHHS